MRVVMLGLNHRTADVAMRERAGFGPEETDAALRSLHENFTGIEALLLSTCNRTELYIAKPAGHGPSADALRAWWAEHREVTAGQLAEVTLLREQEPAVHHLFRVVAGLDSMVVGEPEVQHQVQRAYRRACDQETVGPVLHQVLQASIAAARKARHDTGLSRAGASVGSVALRFAKSVFTEFDDKIVACLGAGEIAKATLRRLVRQRPKRTWVVNRRPSRARETVELIGIDPASGGVRPWDDLDTVLVEADVVVCATAAPHPVVTAERMPALLRRRRNRPLVILDLALPRDVDPEVGRLSNVYLYNLDDLKDVVDHDPQRQAAIQRCEQHIESAAHGCVNALQHRNVGQLVRQLRQKMQTLADVERERTATKLANLLDTNTTPPGERVEHILDEFGHRLINKVLHLPLRQMDTREGDVSLGFYAAALRRLFDLEDLPATEAPPPTEPGGGDSGQSPSAPQASAGLHSGRESSASQPEH